MGIRKYSVLVLKVNSKLRLGINNSLGCFPYIHLCYNLSQDSIMSGVLHCQKPQAQRELGPTLSLLCI